MTLDEDGAHALARRMREAHIMRIDEMPRIELYLDQVLALVSQSLSFMALPGEELITGSMVNNYVKQRVVPAPRRRRYTRRHVATLTFVCAFKRVFSINEIKALYEACIDEGVNVASAYDELAGALEQAVAQRFEGEGLADGIVVTPSHNPPTDGGFKYDPVTGGPAPAETTRVTLVGASGAEVAPGISRVMAAGVEAVADKVFVERSL